MAQTLPLVNPSDENTFKAFERLVSKQRLHRYRRETTTQPEAVALYLWNMALCEALYPSLQFFEVVFRNATHEALSILKGTPSTRNPRWFMDIYLLERYHQEQIKKAWESLGRKGKGHYLGNVSNPQFPKEPARIVAELSFSFWVNLYSDPYTNTIVAPIAAQVFPNGPVTVTRDHRQDVLYPRLSEVLDLRNRVFHQEPIYHWTLPGQSPSLLTRYQRLREVLGWMCATQPAFLDTIDRFPEVHDNGWRTLLGDVEYAFLSEEERMAGKNDP